MLTNELTTRIENDEIYLVPALGNSHTHRVNYQVTLGCDLNDRELFVAKIEKTFFNSEKLVTFRVGKILCLNKFLNILQIMLFLVRKIKLNLVFFI